ncbi:MAG: LptF/LptG family permease, partial [Cyclobacteriaceae bacterium]
FFLVLLLSGFAYINNNYFVTKANLNAYSLLHDIRKKKPSLDIKEGAFYNGIPGYSIKVNEKLGDGKTLKDLIIYDHSRTVGNKEVIIADSGKMYTVNNDRFLKLELFDGNFYQEIDKTEPGRVNLIDQVVRNKFNRFEMTLSLESFMLDRTDKNLFATHRYMKNTSKLQEDVDSMDLDVIESEFEVIGSAGGFFSYLTTGKIDTPSDMYQRVFARREMRRIADSLIQVERDSIYKINQMENPDYYRNKYGNRVRTDSTDTLSTDSAAIVRNMLPSADDEESAEANTTKIRKPILSTEAILARKDSLKKRGRENDEIYNESSATVQEKFFDRNKKIESFNENYAAIELPDSSLIERVDSAFAFQSFKQRMVRQTLNQVRFVKNNITVQTSQIDTREKEIRKHKIEKNKKLSQALACLVMFMIGAPLGAIIKRGGLGVPVIISIVFFIIYYVLTMTMEKQGKEGLMDPFIAVWVANLILAPVGLFFLKQARNDSRVFDSDMYRVFFERIRRKLGEKTLREKQKEMTSS